MNTAQAIGSVSALLPILVSGGILCNAPILRYINGDASGYLLYLRTAGVGLVVCFIAALLLPFAGYFISDGAAYNTYYEKVFFLLESRLFITASAGVVASGVIRYFVLSPLERLFEKRILSSSFIRNRLKKRNPIEKLIINASTRSRGERYFLMVTTDYGKVYVGKPIFDGGNYTAPEEHRALTLLPLMSGYRDIETKK